MKPEMQFRLLFLSAAAILLLSSFRFHGFEADAAAVLREIKKSTYVVHFQKTLMPKHFEEAWQWQEASLRSVSDAAEIMYAYDTVIHGFSARLTEEEAEALEQQHGAVVFPEIRYELHTTRTPLFLGLEVAGTAFTESSSESETIVGVLDTGVWPESRSFNDEGLGPVPAAWKGFCQEGSDFKSQSCNRKLIGARFFSKAYEDAQGKINETKELNSPRDQDGHGTHTATTAAGSAVSGASLLGYASGTARGMAPRARVAAYKVCWTGGCFSSDILAGMEAAINDGVNVLSLSIGGGNPDFYRDSIAIGAFAAMERGIFVACSAGNSGPASYSMSNLAPWIATVGAGTLDRDFPAVVTLGNGKSFTGVSLYSGDPLPNTPLEFVYAGNCSNSTNGNLCLSDTLLPEKVAGKVVLCDRGQNPRVEKGEVVKQAGGAAMVLANTEANGEELVADAHLLPALGVGDKSGEEIRKYLQSDSDATATITFKGTVTGVEPSPVVAAFSSRGPNVLTPEILKPDMIAPGVNILAGWTMAVGPTGMPSDPRQVEFNIVSGTSMSCPHVSGLAALLKGAHPEWSPAAIRSALMTTAYSTYRSGGPLLDIATGGPSTAFDVGAGHVNPVKALDPGLVYDLATDDYVKFLCSLNYTAQQIAVISKRNFSCRAGVKYSPADLNYPSFAVAFTTGKGSGGGRAQVLKYKRVVTNLGADAATYNVSLSSPSPVNIAVTPETLSFRQKNEKKAFVVRFSSKSQPSGTNLFGTLEWSDGKHAVRSPIAISWT